MVFGKLRLGEEARKARRRLGPWHRQRIQRRFLWLRIGGLSMIMALVAVCVVQVFNNYVGGRVQHVGATSAMNEQDRLEERDQIRYRAGSKAPDSSNVVREATNILLVGTDSRSGKNGKLGAGSAAQVVGSRTDSIMLLHVPSSGKPAVLSFPRDLNVNRPPCVSWENGTYSASGDTVSAQRDVKINSLYQAGGPRCLVRSVQELTGMKVDKFIAVDFSGFEGLVNAVGGIDVQVDRPIIDGELGVVVAKPGLIHMDGKQALSYVRVRKVRGDTRGDYNRIERQQKFGMAVLGKLSSGGTLSNPGRMEALSKSIYESVSGEGLSSGFILNMLGRVSDFSRDGIDMRTYPTVGTLANGNEGVDTAAATTMLSAINTGD